MRITGRYTAPQVDAVRADRTWGLILAGTTPEPLLRTLLISLTHEVVGGTTLLARRRGGDSGYVDADQVEQAVPTARRAQPDPGRLPCPPATGPARRSSPPPAALYVATHPESGVSLLRPLLEGVGKTVLAVPDRYVTTSVDVTPWVDVKWRAILAHRGEVARERPLPGILARLPQGDRTQIIQTEHFTRLSPGPTKGDPAELTV
ncbi:hypothetical protein ACIBBD_29150 [Streptomyces sp. NPDC051315]|uniref:hypothetical protein n=1 Tax=Streptomyces sp. NPDC051315 TaxID=3365650 RepID=UPI0037B810EC